MTQIKTYKKLKQLYYILLWKKNLGISFQNEPEISKISLLEYTSINLCTWSFERNLQNLTTIKSNKLRFKKVF